MIELQAPLVADGLASEAQEPRVSPLDDPLPPVAAQLAPVLESVVAAPQMRGDQVDAARPQPRPQAVAVVRAIGNHPRGLLAGTARPRARDGDLRQREFGELDLGDVGRRKVHAERKTRAVDQYHKLRPLTLACEADAGAPLFAGAKVASRKASLQSSWPRASQSLRKARHSGSHTSCRCHSANRRQQVAGLGYCAGRSPQRAPVRSTQRIPSRQPRSSARGRPPWGYRRGLGNSGAIRAHCASVSNGAIRPSLGGFVQDITEQGF